MKNHHNKDLCTSVAPSSQNMHTANMTLTSQWIINRNTDMAFFLVPFLFGSVYLALLYALPQYAFLTTVLVWVLFAQAHFGSTWFIYFDKKNREYYRAHKFIYYLLPLVVFGVVFLGGHANFLFAFLLVSVASLYHVSKQSIGILQIYRHKNGESSVFEKRVEMTAIFAWSMFFTGYGARHLPSFEHTPFLDSFLVTFAIAVLFAIAIATSIMLVWKFFGRQQNSIQKNVFLAGSILLYAPYVYATNLPPATQAAEAIALVCLLAHYMQYMGLVWLINRNKYAEGSVYAAENQFMKQVSGNVFSILIIIFGYGFLLATLRWIVPLHTASLGQTMLLFIFGLQMVHFYIDAFIWRFKNPHVRETTLPFMRPLAAARQQ